MDAAPTSSGVWRGPDCPQRRLKESAGFAQDGELNEHPRLEVRNIQLREVSYSAWAALYSPWELASWLSIVSRRPNASGALFGATTCAGRRL